VSRPNVLVLDEPTNHLDLEAIHALVKALKEFDGTLLFVSHDRAFVQALATRILEVTESGFQDFPGTYEEYLSRAGSDHLDADTVVLRSKKEKKKGEPADRSLSWDEQKKRNNRKSKLPALRDAALAAVEQAEARKAAILERFCAPGFYEQTPPTEIAALEAEEKALHPKIAALVADWEALENELDAATKAG
jgi:ABC-type multidrug transport system ATPase subunit